MNRPRALLSRLRKDRRGVYAVEFALLLPVIFLTIFGLLEVGYQAYIGAVLQGAVNEAGRNSTLETGPLRTGAIDDRVKAQVGNISPSATFESRRKSYTTFSDVGSPEPFEDLNANGIRDPNECFQDINGNGGFDQDRGKQGQGGADDIVSYTMTVTYPRLMPINLFAWTATNSVSATTVLRNQPYNSQSIPAVVCKK